jgi:Collagen triple helix repeat (20 copies)
MYSRIREQFSTTALILSLLALVFAATGGAYAATSAQTSKKPKVVKGPPGKQGKQGKPGATGPTGPQGPAGPAGTAGAKGDPGQNGKSVTVSAIAAETGKCEERSGAEVKPEGSSTGVEVCSGEDGAPGAPGSPWTAGGVLPPGSTESGAWSFSGSEVNGEHLLASIAFAIPLKVGEAPRGEHVHFQGEENFETSCPNPPQAAPGELCIYNAGGINEDALHNAAFVSAGSTISGPPGAGEEFSSSPSGSILQFKFTGATGEEAHGYGSWAVTAPTE